jgi:hypothetical protein
MRKDKRDRKQQQKLLLKKETLRKLTVLSSDDLKAVAGGEPGTTNTRGCCREP